MSEENKNEIPATPLQPAIPTGKPPCPPPVPPCPPPFPPDPFPPVKPMPPCPPPMPHRFHGGRPCTPPWFNPAPKPPIPPEGYDIPALTPYTPGMTIEAQIDYLYNNVNNLIEVFNKCNEKMFGAYECLVNSATCNDAYYGEITTEEGYIGAEPNTCAYKVSHIPFIDRAGQPIYLELGLPYNSTINDGGAENCYSASIRTLADKLIPATQSGEKWQGWVIQKGKQINAPQPPIIKQDDKSYYIMGVTENGFIKWYPSTVSIRTLNVEKVRNCMNCSAILINQGQITPELFSPVGDQTLARTAVGMNYKTKERFIITVEGSEQTGCTEQQLAELFLQYGCDVAVQTAYSTSAFAMDKGMMEFMPATVDSDAYPTMPEVSGFWYITKRRNYHNELVKEIAELMQRMGEQIWYDWINADSVDYVKSRIVEVVQMIEDESINRENADTDLRARVDALNANDIDHVENVPLSVTKDAWYIFLKSGEKVEAPIVTYNYDRLVAHLQTYDNFETSLAEEVAARQAADDTLRGLITATNNDLSEEIANRKAADDELRAMFTDPNSAIMQLIRQVETTLQGNIDTETTARINGDNAIRALLTAEQEARIAGDQTLTDNLANFRAEYTQFVTKTNGDITNLTDSLNTLTTNINTEITDIKSRLTNAEGDIDTLQNSYNEITNRVTAINAAVTALQSAFNTLETSFDNIKEAFAGIQQTVVELSNKIDALTAQLGDIEGDIKKKIEDGPWLERVNVGAPDGTLSRTMRPDINGVFFSMPGEDGQPDSLSEVKVANPTTEQSAVPYGYHEESIANAIADAHNYTDEEIDKIVAEQGNYMPKSGGTFTGMVSLAQAPTTGVNIANKEYVDTTIEQAIADIPKGDYLELSGGTMTGDINMAGTTSLGSQRVRFNTPNSHYVRLAALDDDSAGEAVLNVTSDKQGARIFGVKDPTDDKEAANKRYVDQKIAEAELTGDYLPLTGGKLTGNLTMGAVQTGDMVDSAKVMLETAADGSSHIDVMGYEDDGTAILSVGTDTAGKDVIIRGVKTPVGASDAVPKSYLDDLIGAEMEVEWDERVSIIDSTALNAAYTFSYTPPKDGIIIYYAGATDGNEGISVVSEIRDGSTTLSRFESHNAEDFTHSVPVSHEITYVISCGEKTGDYHNNYARVNAYFIPFRKLSVAIEENASVRQVWGEREANKNTSENVSYTIPADGIFVAFTNASSGDVNLSFTINGRIVGVISDYAGYNSTLSLPVKAGEIISWENPSIITVNYYFIPYDLQLLAKLGSYMPITGGKFEGPVSMKSPVPENITYLPLISASNILGYGNFSIPPSILETNFSFVQRSGILELNKLNVIYNNVTSAVSFTTPFEYVIKIYDTSSTLLAYKAGGPGTISLPATSRTIDIQLFFNADLVLYLLKGNSLINYTAGAGGYVNA